MSSARNQSDNRKAAREGAVKLPKPNKGQVIPKGLWLPFLHSHTQPKRSA